MTVADARGRRWDAATGIGFAVLGVVGFGLAGAPPKAGDSASKITHFFVDKRDELLAGNVMLFVGVLLFLWFLGSVRSYLRAAEGGEGRLSAAAFGGGVVGSAMLLGGLAATNAAAFRVAGDHPDPNLIRALFDLSTAFFAFSGVGFAVFFAGASCSAARSGALPAWLYWTGSVAALLQVVGLTTLFAKSGALAAGGAISFVTPIASLLWVLVTSILLMRRDGVPPVARAEP
jgi:hypothetical protein